MVLSVPGILAPSESENKVQYICHTGPLFDAEAPNGHGKHSTSALSHITAVTVALTGWRVGKLSNTG